jgi:hypothetical protein
MRMRHTVICGLPRSTILVHTVIHGKVLKEKKMLLDMKCVFGFSLQLLSETFLILRTERDIITNVDTSSCTVPAIVVRL